MTSAVKSLTTGLTLLVLATCATLAMADDVSFGTGGYASALRTKEMMEKMDTNGDGMVSKDEWTKFQNRAFDGLDKDKSGYLTEAEWTGHANENFAFATAAYARGLMTDSMFKKIDANGDGKISREEFLAYHRKIWDMLDKNKKGAVGLVDFIRPPGS
jgi:Ca2+-binding EF-hand superfamily protein